MKKKKKEALYAPLQFVQSIIPEPEAEWTKDLTECEDHFAHLRSIKQYGLKDTPQNRQNIARNAFMAADWNRSKQAYRITKELAEDLFGMEDMSFPARAIRLPYRTIYLDLEEADIRLNPTGLSGEYKFSGVILTYGDIKFQNERTTFCGFVTLMPIHKPENQHLAVFLLMRRKRQRKIWS